MFPFCHPVFGGSADPLGSSVALLLHGDGTNGSTTFTDSSRHGISVTPSGATISTAQSKFGGASMYFNGSSSAAIAASAFGVLGTGDFTVEFFVYATSLSSQPMTVDYWVSSSGTFSVGQWQIQIDTAGNPAFYCATSTSAYTTYAPSGATVPVNTWTHVALVRSSGVLKFYVGGTYVGTSLSFSSTVGVSSAGSLGQQTNSGSNKLAGYLDEVRITTAARYTSNFTPPTAAFPNP